MKTAITRARVFDGRRVREPGTVVIDGDDLGTDPGGAEVVDADGGVLLPGLIDAHIHLNDQDTLRQLASWGVTTGLDMATWPAEHLASLRQVAGLTDIRSSGLPAIGPSGPHSHMPGMPPEAVLLDPAQADPFVAARDSEGADYIKIVTEAPGAGGPDQATLNALVTAAHQRGKRTIAHAASTGAFDMALAAGVDMITHAPVDRPLDAASVARIADHGVVVVPTLTMMHSIATARGLDYTASESSVGALHQAGAVVLAGTDANASPGSPTPIAHGESLHHELELLTDAGLSTVETLRAVTTSAAEHFGLTDRGVIAPGYRADLVLIDGDPTVDIRATRDIRRVWCAGTELAR